MFLFVYKEHRDATGVYVSIKEQKDLDVIYQVMRGEISSKEAAFRINKSYQQTLRIIEKVQKKGLFVTHYRFEFRKNKQI